MRAEPGTMVVPLVGAGDRRHGGRRDGDDEPDGDDEARPRHAERVPQPP